MGKRLITQRRGRGGPRYQFPSHRFEGEIKYPAKVDYVKGIGGQVINIEDDAARTAPVARVLLEDMSELRMLAPEGMQVGQWVTLGGEGKAVSGNVLELGNIPEGTPVYNIEHRPGDGGKIARSSGSSASIVGHERVLGVTFVKMPSKKTISINSKAKATVGIVAGGGRTDKPMVRAGQAWFKHKARNKVYPTVRGVAKNACNHPHGGGSHGYTGRPASVSRNTPPGRKVGHIAPSRTGRLKR
jgi:large subunit ribosomal protein L2